MLLRYLVFLSMLCCSFSLTAQSGGDVSGSIPMRRGLDKKESEDPKTLVEALTKDKAGDQEKFEALYAWVAWNIRYDYGTYYAASVMPPNTLARTLKTRSGMCLDYASLMDTLCRLAGLSSAIVTGYATDEFFDVNDSIFANNHAWNAVKLDDYWYLYDVTWGAGQREWSISRGSKWHQQQIVNFKMKYRRVRTGGKYDRLFRAKCKEETSTTKAYYFRWRYFNRLKLLVLMRWPVRYTLSYKEQLNNYYYLSDPSVFARTHFPDDPTWNLGVAGDIRSMETDSAHYYLTDSVLAQQNHTGVICAECDAYTGLSPAEQAQWQLSKAQAFNTRNAYASGMAHHELMQERWEEKRNEQDPVRKKSLKDSTLYYLQQLYGDIAQCRNNEKRSFRQQRTKSLRKQQLLLNENKQHIAFIREQIKTSQKQGLHLRQVESLMLHLAHAYESGADQVKHTKPARQPEKPALSPKRLKEVTARLEKRRQQIDSLQQLIVAKQTVYDSLCTNLSLNIWQQRYLHDSLALPIKQGTILRHKQFDNYKKPVADLRKRLDFHERNYALIIDQQVVRPADSCFVLFKEINYYTKWKQAYQKESLELLRLLVRGHAATEQEWAQERQTVHDDFQKDYCWIWSMAPRTFASGYGFEMMDREQKYILSELYKENAAERDRHSQLVLPELKRQYRKRMDMNANNQKYVLRLTKKLKKEK